MIIHIYIYNLFLYDLRLPHFTARPSATCTALRKWKVCLYDIAQCWQRKEFFVSYHHQSLDHPGSSEASLPVTSVAFARASFATTCGREELLFDQRPWKVVGFVPSAFAVLFAPLKVSNVGRSWVLSRNPIWNPIWSHMKAWRMSNVWTIDPEKVFLCQGPIQACKYT